MEEWIAVKGYEGLYEINKQGNVKSLQKRNMNKLLSTRIDRAGYLTIRLNRNGECISKFVHRLLAENFIVNPVNKKSVNHINGNKLDNRVENLEWVTHSENILHAYRSGLCKTLTRSSRIVDTCSGEKFDSIKEAADFYSLNYATCKGYLNGTRNNPTCLKYITQQL